VYITGILAN